jgi:hypothetical protein
MADPLSWGDFGASIAAIGAFGTAAFGVVESAGKAIAFSTGDTDHRRYIGLPYSGFGKVRKMLGPLKPALKCAYGHDYLEIIAQQYYSDRSAGTAPDLIRQGVRLGLPFLDIDVAQKIIGKIWSLDAVHSQALATALQSSSDAALDGAAQAQAQALAGRFASALDARINAAFDIAEERYETQLKTAAGAVAIILACVFNYALGAGSTNQHGLYPWAAAIAVGLIAVPLAPVAKDLSSSLQNALTSFKSIAGKV